MAPVTPPERLSRLRNILSSPLSQLRPLLTHLSADNSWVLSIPIAYNSASQGGKSAHGKNYIHLLLDAWLTPSNTPFASAAWYQVQSHIEVPAYESIADVIGLITDIETAASTDADTVFRGNAEIDVVVSGHWGPDHLDRDTLTQVNQSVPVFVPDRSVPIVQSWNHFETVVEIPNFGESEENLDWRTASSTQEAFLPSWLTVWRIYGPKMQPALHWGVCIIFGDGGVDQAKTECVIHTPHGLYIEDAAVMKRANPPIKTLALMHTTKESFFYRWGKANLGAPNGIQVAQVVEPRYCKFNSARNLRGSLRDEL